MAFARPQRLQNPAAPRAVSPLRPVRGATSAEPSTPASEEPPRPDAVGTGLLLAALAVTAVFLTGRTSCDLARFATISVGVGIAASVLADARRGLRNLVRADLMALLAFYFLTLFEFILPQPMFDLLSDRASTRAAIMICLCAFAGLAIGRHLSTGRTQPMRELLTRPVSEAWMLMVFWSCFFIGYLHMLVAVHFDVFDLVDKFVAPRFAQPWGRGKLGDWKALFYELGMLIFLLPPLAGVMLARRQHYSKGSLALVLAGFLFTLFYGFSSGTRHILHAYLVTFLIGFAFASGERQRKELITLGIVCAAVLVLSTGLMLRFRTVGLKNYLQGDRQEFETQDQTLNVDFNLYPIGRLAAIFPKQRDYLGLEIFYQALIRPIPRAIWKGKPEGMSLTIEEAVGAEGWTVAASFAGEAYMAGGWIVVFIVALGFGYIGAWWNRLASPDNSQFGVLVFASGFFAVVISMRSLLVFTTAMLPTVAAMVGGSMLITKTVNRVQRGRLGR